MPICRSFSCQALRKVLRRTWISAGRCGSPERGRSKASISTSQASPTVGWASPASNVRMVSSVRFHSTNAQGGR